MTWIEWQCNTPQSDVVAWLAEELHITLAQALGHYNAVCCALGNHREDGDLSAINDRGLEAWALWEGKRGVFAAVFRRRCQDEAGVMRGWWRQARLFQRREADRERARAAMRKARDVMRNIREGSSEPLTHTNQPTNQPTRTSSAAREDDELTQATANLPDHHRQAVQGALHGSRNPRALTADLLARLHGMPGHQAATATELGQALHDMAVAGARVSVRALDRFVLGVREGHTLPARASHRSFEAEREVREAVEIRKFLAREEAT